jgi:hypothetical protein
MILPPYLTKAFVTMMREALWWKLDKKGVSTTFIMELKLCIEM